MSDIREYGGRALVARRRALSVVRLGIASATGD